MLSNHSDDCIFYLDESGDLGFGDGASDTFVIAAVCVDRGKQDQLKRLVRRFKSSRSIPPSVELKANATRAVDRDRFCRELADLECSAHYIVVNKNKVKTELRRDTNILYNYVTGLMLGPLLCNLLQAQVHLDCRTIKVASGNSLSEYLRIKLWCEMNSPVNVALSFPDSRQSLGIQAADFVANAVFRKYERRDSSGYSALSRIIGVNKRLFF